MLTYTQEMKIAVTKSIIERYGVMMDMEEIGNILGYSHETIKNKASKNDNDLPVFTQLKGKKVVMAQDLAEWMLNNARAKL